MNGSRELSAEVADPHISDPEANSVAVPRFPRSRSEQESARQGSTKAESTPYVCLEFHLKSSGAEEVHAPSQVTESKEAALASRFPDGEAHTTQTTTPCECGAFHITQTTEPRACLQRTSPASRNRSNRARASVHCAVK